MKAYPVIRRKCHKCPGDWFMVVLYGPSANTFKMIYKWGGFMPRPLGTDDMVAVTYGESVLCPACRAELHDMSRDEWDNPFCTIEAELSNHIAPDQAFIDADMRLAGGA